MNDSIEEIFLHDTYADKGIQRIMAPVHECGAQKDIAEAAKGAKRPAPAEWGESIGRIISVDGQWWAVDGGDPPEYATPIRYCPWCGIELGSGDR